MPFNIIKFFNPEYLLDLQPTISLSTVWWVVGFCVIAVIAGVVLLVIEKQKKTEHIIAKLLMRYRHIVWTVGGLSLLYVWLRYEQVFFISARFWIVIGFLATVVWLGFVVRYQMTVVPQALKQAAQKRQLNKYIPTKKK